MQMYMNASAGGFLPPYRLPSKYPFVNLPYIFQYLPMLYQAPSAQTWRCPVDNFFDPTEMIFDRNNYPEPMNGQIRRCLQLRHQLRSPRKKSRPYITEPVSFLRNTSIPGSHQK